MPLIKCPDCSRDVSDVAPSCPQCGRPFTPSTRTPVIAAAPVSAQHVQTVEQTGKQYKAAVALGSIGLVLGLLVTCIGSVGRSQSGETGIGFAQGLGCAIASLGLASYVFGRFFGWWDHG